MARPSRARPHPTARRLGLEALEARETPAVVGGLDPSFSPGGPVAGVTDVSTGREFVGVAVQQDGKLVAISDIGPDFYITRFDADGTRDTTFGNAGTGVVFVDVGGAGAPDAARGVAIDAQNRIVVAGSGGAAVSNFALVRLSADGKTVELNTSFHVGNPADAAFGRAVAVQSATNAGAIVIAGDAKVGPDRDFALIRVDPTTGTLIGPTRTSTFTPGDDIGRGVTVYTSGPNLDKIVVVGTTGNVGDVGVGVLQRNPDGTPDATFVNAGGQFVFNPTTGSDIAAGVDTTPTGSIVVVGNNGAPDVDIVVAQVLPTGGFDPVFNGGAVKTLALAGVQFGRAVAVQRDGKIVVVGDAAAAQDVGVFRLTPGGALDPSFNGTGDGTFNANGNDDGNAVAIDNNGRIVVAGDDDLSAGFLARLIGTVEKGTELAVGGSFDGRAVVYTPDAAGTFATPAPTPANLFPGFAGNVRTAVADVNGDGVADTILVTGPGTPVRFAVVSGTDLVTVLIPPTAPFAGSEAFAGGGFVAAADFDNDGRAELVFTPDQGGGPRVTIFSLAGTTPVVRANFFGIDDAGFRGGARAGAGDVNGDGFADLVVSAGFGGGPRVAVFGGATIFTTQTKLVGDFFAFPDVLRNGVYVAVGDVDGDGFADLVIGAGPGGGPQVLTLSGRTLIQQGSVQAGASPLSSFFVAGTDSDRGGVRVAVVDADGDNRADVATGTGEARPNRVRVYLGRNFTGTGEPGAAQDLTPFGAGTSLADGVYVG